MKDYNRCSSVTTMLHELIKLATSPASTENQQITNVLQDYVQPGSTFHSTTFSINTTLH